jgi:acyl-CoA synthetase (AMP-forming)/AMP-acid ligase II
MPHERSANVAALLAGPLASYSGATALIEGSGLRRMETTFAALNQRAQQIAAQLRGDGVRAGESVLLFAAPGAAMYATLIAVLRLGAVAMFVDPSADRSVIDDACAMWPPKAFVGSPKAHLLRFVSRAVRCVPNKYVTAGWMPAAARLAPLGSGRLNEPIEAVAPDAPALVTFTSGSTGRPKGAVRTHSILRSQLAALSEGLAARVGDRELVSLPIVVLINLANGAETVIPDADLRRPGTIDAEPVLTQITQDRVTRITASPAFLERLADAPGAARAFARLDTIVTGGGPVFPDLVAHLSRLAPTARVFSVYGSTEAEPIAHVEASEVSAEDIQAMREGAGLLAGVPNAIVQLRIIRRQWGTPIAPLDATAFDAMTCPRREPGEIVVAGPHVVPGYLRGIGDEETKFRVDGTVWHRTGDVGYQDERGRLWLLGRASAVIEDADGTLYPFAVECAARELLGARRLAAVSHDGRRVLVVESADGSEPDAVAVRDRLAWARLDRVVTCRALPMDRRHNSKVDYAAVARMLAR